MTTPQRDTVELAEQLAEVGRAVRDVVRSGRDERDHVVVRTEGGDDVFGVDARADEVLIDELERRCGPRWPGRLVMEGYDEPIRIGSGEVGGSSSTWTYLADPIDGTRGHLAGTHSAWVLLGAGRHARTLEDLEVGAAVEIPNDRAAVGMVARADRYGYLRAQDDALFAPTSTTAPTSTPASEFASTEVELVPTPATDLVRRFVTVVRLLPGGHGPIGEWADTVLQGLEVYDNLYPCTGGQLMEVAGGQASAALDPRPLLHAAGFHTHPYDMAALVVARAAGVIVEALPPGPLDTPIDTHTPVAWAAYANESVAEQLRARLP